MSELINNREERKKILRELIKELHEGKGVEEVKERFNDLIQGVGATEISQIEQSLISEGLPVDEVKRLCDVHVAVFKESLDKTPQPETVPGHPVYIFKEENRAIEKVIDEDIALAIEALSHNNHSQKDDIIKLREGLNKLADIEKHYNRKENLLFPYLEKYEVSGPSSVMWGIHDDIRAMLKDCSRLGRAAMDDNTLVKELIEKVREVSNTMTEMIYKEENILFPMALELLYQDEWGHILEQSDEIGYCLIEPTKQWKPNEKEKVAKEEIAGSESTEGYLKFETGILKLKEISAIFNHLPIDITFVDKDNIVKYFSMGKERFFTRTKSIIGRKVENCHPPASVHVVEKIVEDFIEGRREHADFWIRLKGKFLYIRYFAVKDEKGEYMGTLEVTQEISEIQELEGEKRLLDN